MKILTGSQQPTIAQQTADSKAEATESAATQPQTAAKTDRKRDTVELSTASGKELGNQQAAQLQSKRVDALKSLVSAGKYQVSSRDVAEKMLSGFRK